MSHLIKWLVRVANCARSTEPAGEPLKPTLRTCIPSLPSYLLAVLAAQCLAAPRALLMRIWCVAYFAAATAAAGWLYMRYGIHSSTARRAAGVAPS